MKKTNSRNLLFMALTAVIILLTMESTARLYWKLLHDVPFRRPDKVLYAYYEGLREIDETRPRHDDDWFDLLILAGSVPYRKISAIEPALREELARRGLKKVRVFNLAAPGHSSRDSLLKYQACADAEFDLVLFYHAINEVRANNIPPQLFRDDYSHCTWYALVNPAAKAHNRAFSALPATAQTLRQKLRHRLNPGRYIPFLGPRKEWMQYGAEPRSASPFKNNLQRFLEEAARRGDPVALATYALHIPSNYTREAFERGELDYCRHQLPVELWGRPEDVRRTVAAHNAVVRELAERFQPVLFIDQDALIEKSGRYFNDPCHLTVEGGLRFVENLLAPGFPR